MSDRPPPAAPARVAVTPNQAAGGLGALVGVGCAALLAHAIPQVESGGKQHLMPYRDIAGVWTVCDGDTAHVVPGRPETVQGCKVRLDKRLTRDFAPAVLRRAPELKGHDWPLAAAIVFAYNIGPSGWAGSTAATRFAAGDFRGGCAALGPYYTVTDARGRVTTVPGWINAGGKVSPGLVNRRTAERTLCLTGKLS